MFSDQSQFNIRCEWGNHALQALAPSDVIIIVDVLSFSTCVEIALTNDAVVLPYPMGQEGHEVYAKKHSAHLATQRGTEKYSLSPLSLKKIPEGTRLVLPSPNGSHLTFHAKGNCILAGCLRNAQAIAEFAQRSGQNITIIPAGERWKDDGTLRLAVEDLIGAGSIINYLKGSQSPESRIALAAFQQVKDCLQDTLLKCASGRELVDKGFSEDVKLAAELNVSTTVPLFKSPEYIKSEEKSGSMP